MIRLERPTRYHLCAAQQDLFCDWDVWRAWGAKGRGLGNCRRDPAAAAADAAQQLAAELQTCGPWLPPGRQST
jgi:hypothetical protein